MLSAGVNAFAEVAEHVELAGRRALQVGRLDTAREALLRATNYYFAADHYATTDVYWRKSVNCFQLACGLFRHPIESLAIPYQDITLPGYFVPAQAPARGTILAMSGFDGTAEWLYFALGAGLAQRGYNVLLFEGPGHRGMSYRHPDRPFRPDYEVPIKAVVDYALTRSDIDPDRVGLYGHSFGGHLVLRGAAFDPRCKVLIADSPVTDFASIMLRVYPPDTLKLPPPVLDKLAIDMLPQLPATLQASSQRLYASLNVSRASDYVQRIAQFKFDAIEQITCPVLCLVSEGEGISALQETQHVYDTLSNPQKALVKFSAQDGADAHVQCNNLMVQVQSIADWLDNVWN